MSAPRNTVTEDLEAVKRVLDRVNLVVSGMAEQVEALENSREQWKIKLGKDRARLHDENKRLERWVLRIIGPCENNTQGRCWNEGRPQGRNGSVYTQRWCYPCMAYAALNPDEVVADESSQVVTVDPDTWPIGQAVRYRKTTAGPWQQGVYLGIDADTGMHQISDQAGDIKLFEQLLVPLVQAAGRPPVKLKLA